MCPLSGESGYIQTTVHMNHGKLTVSVAAAQGRGGCDLLVVFFGPVMTRGDESVGSKTRHFILTNQCTPSIINDANIDLNYGGFLSARKNKKKKRRKRGSNSHIPDFFPLGKVVDVAVQNGRQFELPSKWNSHCRVPFICFCTSKLLPSVFPTPFVE